MVGGVFLERENSLGSYYDAIFFQDIGCFRMDIILVGLETSKGLTEDLVFMRGKYRYQLTLDYKGIPFICG
jgi:hypothetical protein